MAISETQLSEMISARERAESMLSDVCANTSLLNAFHLPDKVAADVREQLVVARDIQSRATALLKALDWLTSTNPCQALGIAFALQSFWAGRGQENSQESRDRAVAFVAASIG
jgi:hypothetical protein